MKTKHDEVMRLFKDQSMQFSATSDKFAPIVKVGFDNFDDRNTFFDWITTITGEKSPTEGQNRESVILHYADDEFYDN